MENKLEHIIKEITIFNSGSSYYNFNRTISNDLDFNEFCETFDEDYLIKNYHFKIKEDGIIYTPKNINYLK